MDPLEVQALVQNMLDDPASLGPAQRFPGNNEDGSVPVWDARSRQWVSSANKPVSGRQIDWHYGDTPPVQAQDGDIWLYQTYGWLFRYDISIATNRWRFIGGAPIGNTSNVAKGTAGGGVNLLFADVATTVPRTGQYLVSFFTDAQATPNAGTATIQWFMQAWDNTSSTAVTNFITMASFYAPIAQVYQWTGAASNQSAALTAGHSIILKANPAPQNWDFVSTFRGVSFIPVAVS